MRVYYVGSDSESGYNTRCLLPIQAHGWDGDRTSIIPQSKSPEDKTKGVIHADIVVFHQPENKEKLELARHLKKLGKKIVFDSEEEYTKSQKAFIKEADLVTVSNKFLLQAYKKLNKNTVVLPNTIDPFYFDEPLKNESRVVRVGITKNSQCLPLSHYENDPRVEIVYVSSDYDSLNSARLDIHIMSEPSNIQFLESSMFEIPVVADGLSTQYPLEDAKHLLLAFSFEDWINHIDSLIESKQKRVSQGTKAREYVLKNYDINRTHSLWEEAYNTLN